MRGRPRSGTGVASALRGLTIPLIVWMAAGCDNVDWGGLHVSVVQPSPPEERAEPPPEEETPEAPLPEAPLLHAVVGSGDTVRLVPVAALTGRGLATAIPRVDPEGTARRIAEERLPEGRPVTLYARGSRVGTAYLAGAASLDTTYCPVRPVARGVVELVRGASGAESFLGIPADGEPSVPRSGYEPSAPGGVHRLGAFRIASAEVGRRGARWPRDWIRARVDLQTLRPREDGPEAFAATYLVRDALDTSAPGEEAWSLFILARRRAEAWEPVFLWYRDYDDVGKAAPRLHDAVDLDGDGVRELVLELFLEGARSWAVVGLREGRWRVLHADRCLGDPGVVDSPAPASPAPAPEGGGAPASPGGAGPGPGG